MIKEIASVVEGFCDHKGNVDIICTHLEITQSKLFEIYLETDQDLSVMNLWIGYLVTLFFSSSVD